MNFEGRGNPIEGDFLESWNSLERYYFYYRNNPPIRDFDPPDARTRV